MNNFETIIGDSFTLNLTITDSNGVAQDITDWIFALTLKKNKGLDDTASGVISVSGIISTAVSGTMYYTLPPESTSLYDGTYYYDAQYKDTTNAVYTILSGVITFLKDITKRY